MPTPVQRREALEELGDPFDRLPAQVGLVARSEAGHVVAELVRLVGESGECLVDEVDGGRLAPPAEEELDRLVRHLPPSTSRAPREVVGGEVVGLAAEHAGDAVLGDEQPGLGLFAVQQSLTQLGERGFGVGTQFGDEVGSNTTGGSVRRKASSVRCWTGVSPPPNGAVSSSVIGRTVPT